MAVEDVFAASHGVIWHNLRYYVNPITAKLEPITFDDHASESMTESYPDYLFQKNSIITRAAFENDEFSDIYFEKLFTLSSNFDDFITMHMEHMNQMSFIINRDDPGYQYDEVLEKLHKRQDDIQDLFNDKGTVCEIEFDQNNEYTLSITNKNIIPVYVHNIDPGNVDVSFEPEADYPIKIDGSSDKSFEINEVDEKQLKKFLFIIN